ncbi:MAG: alpha/beta fold hydrolase [Parasphingopyxis sp.]
MREPSENYFGEGESRLCYFEWGEPEGQVILLLHATGFHARCWDRVVDAIPAEFRVIAVDHLGHGRSAKPDTLGDWSKTAAPLVELAQGLDLKNVIGVGHSMGGHCLLQMAAEIGDRFERLVLIDPVIMDPAYYRDPNAAGAIDPSDHPVARRRANWDSPEQMADRLRGHPSYAIWHPDILMDYCRYGLLPSADGKGFELACPPALEASVYLGSLRSDPYPMVAGLKVPVTILRAPPGSREGALDFTLSPTWPGLVDAFPDARETYLPDLTHFMPMQDPGRIAKHILDEDMAS